MPRRPRIRRRSASPRSTWHEVDLLRSSVSPLTGSTPQAYNYRARLATLEALGDPQHAPAARVGTLGPRGQRVLRRLGVLALIAAAAFVVYAVRVGSPGDILELAGIILYLVAFVVLVPLSFVVVVYLVKLPFRAIGALRRRR